MEDHKHDRIGHIVHNTVVLFKRGVLLIWCTDHALFSRAVISRQHLTEVHELVSIAIGFGVGVTG